MQLQWGEHIGQIFVQCWEKTSLHSLCQTWSELTLVQAWTSVTVRWPRSLKPFFSCFSSSCRNLLMACSISFWSGLASMLSSSWGSGADCAEGGFGMSSQASRKPAYTMISLVFLGCLRLCSKLKPQIKLNWDISLSTCKSQFDKRYPGISLLVTYPWISPW